MGCTTTATGQLNCSNLANTNNYMQTISDPTKSIQTLMNRISSNPGQQMMSNTTSSINNSNLDEVIKNIQSPSSKMQVDNTIVGNNGKLVNLSGVATDQYNLMKQAGYDVSKMQFDEKTQTWSGSAYQENSFMQNYGSSIKTGLTAGSLALGVMNYMQSKGLISKQKEALDEQIETSRANREHLEQEWGRISKLRKAVNTQYRNNKAKVKLSSDNT